MAVSDDSSFGSGVPEPRPFDDLRPACWDARRERIYVWLSGQRLSLAELYRGAVMLLYEEAVPGRVRFVFHAVREINNRLPDLLLAETAGRRPNASHVLDEITKIWTAAGLPLDGSAPPGDVTEGSSDGVNIESVRIPVDRYRSISRRLGEWDQRRESFRERITQMLSKDLRDGEGMESLVPQVSAWYSESNRYHGLAHDSGRTDADNDMDQIKDLFDRFETRLLGVIGPFYETVDVLDEILEDTNA